MAQTYVNTFFFDGALSIDEVSTRVGPDATPASTLVFENIRAATRRLAWASAGIGTFFVHFYSPLDRLHGLSSVLWRNRDIQYVEDIGEIRKAISELVGETEDKLFLAPSPFLVSKYEQASDCKFFTFDCALRKGNWRKEVLSISAALDGQIAEFWATRFDNTKTVRTMVLRSVTD